MKKSLAALAIAVLFLVPRGGLAQTSTPTQEGPLNIDAVPAEQRDQVWGAQAKKNVISMNLLPPIGGVLLSVTASSLLGSAAGIISVPIEYELAVSRGMSIFALVQPSFIGATAGGQSASAFGFGAGVGLRGYFSGNAPQGFWLGGEGDFPIYPAIDGVTVRLESGYAFMFSTNLTLSIGGGLGLTYSNVTNPLTGAPLGFFPAVGLRISLGYAL